MPKRQPRRRLLPLLLWGLFSLGLHRIALGMWLSGVVMTACGLFVFSKLIPMLYENITALSSGAEPSYGNPLSVLIISVLYLAWISSDWRLVRPGAVTCAGAESDSDESFVFSSDEASSGDEKDRLS